MHRSTRLVQNLKKLHHRVPFHLALFLGLLLRVDGGAAAQTAPSLYGDVPAGFNPTSRARLADGRLIMAARNADFVVLLRTDATFELIAIPVHLRAVGIIPDGSDVWIVDCCGNPAVSLFRQDTISRSFIRPEGRLAGIVGAHGSVVSTSVMGDSLVVQFAESTSTPKTLMRLPIQETGGVIAWLNPAGTAVSLITRRPPFREWTIRITGGSINERARLFADDDSTSLILDAFSLGELDGYVVGNPKVEHRRLVVRCSNGRGREVSSDLPPFTLVLPTRPEASLLVTSPNDGLQTLNVNLNECI